MPWVINHSLPLFLDALLNTIGCACAILVCKPCMACNGRRRKEMICWRRQGNSLARTQPPPHEGGTMQKFTFDHIHLFSRDPEATAAFYERMFGAEIIRSLPQGKPRIDLKLGGANIFILDVSQDPKAVPGRGHPQQGLEQFGLEVADIVATCAGHK